MKLKVLSISWREAQPARATGSRAASPKNPTEVLFELHYFPSQNNSDSTLVERILTSLRRLQHVVGAAGAVKDTRFEFCSGFPVYPPGGSGGNSLISDLCFLFYEAEVIRPRQARPVLPPLHRQKKKRWGGVG